MKYALILFLIFFAGSAFGVNRSTTERDRFAKANPCPANAQKVYFGCTGWNINHTVPLCVDPKGDVAANMTWMKVGPKKSRDAIERAYCACVKKQGKDFCPTVNWK